jgi:hypothetical protein
MPRVTIDPAVPDRASLDNEITISLFAPRLVRIDHSMLKRRRTEQ